MTIFFNRFVPAKGPADVISGIFKQKFEGAWPTWKAVDESVRDRWFEEFQVVNCGPIETLLCVTISAYSNLFFSCRKRLSGIHNMIGL